MLLSSTKIKHQKNVVDGGDECGWRKWMCMKEIGVNERGKCEWKRWV